MSRRDPFAAERRLSSEHVIAYRAGALTSAERRRVERACAGDPELGSLLDAPAAGARRPALAAAAALVLAGLACLGGWRIARGGGPGPGIAVALHEGRCDDAAARLAELALAPEGGGDAQGPARARRGTALQLLRPLGHSTALRPLLRWSAPDGGGPYRVRVHDEDGIVLVDVETAAAEARWPDGAPPLVPGGRYLVEVRDKAYARREEHRAFAVADEPVRAAVRAELDAVERALGSGPERGFARALVLAAHRAWGEAADELLSVGDALDVAARTALVDFLDRRGDAPVAELLRAGGW